jgi:hypothetical protein
MSQLLLRTFRELPLLTVLLSDPAGLLWGSSRGGGDGAGLAELSLTSYMSTTHVRIFSLLTVSLALLTVSLSDAILTVTGAR